MNPKAKEEPELDVIEFYGLATEKLQAMRLKWNDEIVDVFDPEDREHPIVKMTATSRCMFAAFLQELKINPDFLNRNVNEGGRNALHLFGKAKS